MKDNIFNNFGMELIMFGASKSNPDLTNTGDLEDYDHETIKTTFFCELRKFGQTTSLDIKNKLRKLGFFAEQDQVSNDIRAIRREVDLIEVFDNGIYLTYYIDENQMDNPGIIKVDVINNSVISSSVEQNDKELSMYKSDIISDILTGNDLSYTRRNGDVMVASKIGYTGEWECSYNGVIKSCEILFFNKKWTRDQVRAAYASLNLVKINDVRAKKIN